MNSDIEVEELIRRVHCTAEYSRSVAAEAQRLVLESREILAQLSVSRAGLGEILRRCGAQFRDEEAGSRCGALDAG